jgi:hypothetical protein
MNIITLNIINRVFLIKYQESLGTCFALDIDNKQYIITAKHVIAGITDGETVYFAKDGGWDSFQIHLIGHHENSDVSVFSLNIEIASEKLVMPANDSFSYGQDIRFLGYPYGMYDYKHGLAVRGGFPIPLIKAGIVSSFDSANQNLYIDGINNPGFSGGPVIFEDSKTHDFYVGGIISGYRCQKDKVMLGKNETDLLAFSNSGIIIATSIRDALSIIEANPTGYELSHS